MSVFGRDFIVNSGDDEADQEFIRHWNTSFVEHTNEVCDQIATTGYAGPAEKIREGLLELGEGGEKFELVPFNLKSIRDILGVE